MNYDYMFMTFSMLCDVCQVMKCVNHCTPNNHPSDFFLTRYRPLQIYFSKSILGTQCQDKIHQCMGSSSVPRLDSIMVIF